MKLEALPTPAGALAPLNTHAPKPPSDQALKAGREFESLLLRHMLDSMQKTSQIGKSENHSSSAYQSMAMEALADGVERGGGLGLADLVAKSLEFDISGRSR